MKRFKLMTVAVGVVTGASTVAMLANKQPFTYVTGTFAILSFIGLIILDLKED